MRKNEYEKGMGKRIKVLGAKYVNKTLNKQNEFNKDFQEFITTNCWNMVWNNKYLSDKQKVLIIYAYWLLLIN